MKCLPLLLAALLACSPCAHAAATPDVPVKGMATVVELGSKACIPCKMMIPVLEAIEKRYAGKAAVVFIDVWEQSEQAEKFGVRAIPTQIFFDKEGKEVSRHEGFLDEKPFAAMLDKLLAH